jgi:hypothetical protein
VGPRAGLDDMEKRKFLNLQELELRPLCRQPVASRYTDCAIPAHIYIYIFWVLIASYNNPNKEYSNESDAVSCIRKN